MKVYVFGSRDVPGDGGAIEAAEKLAGSLEGVSFVFVAPNEDVPFADEERVVVMDTVLGLRETTLLCGEDVGRLAPPPRATVHDFDLSFQLRYLRKIGRLGEVSVVGVPPGGPAGYARLRSILRKLVAQDMQGS